MHWSYNFTCSHKLKIDGTRVGLMAHYIKKAVPKMSMSIKYEKYKFSEWVWKSLYLPKHVDIKDWKDSRKKYCWSGVGRREESCWERFHLVTVAIGTIYELLKIPVPKEDRSSKQNKTNKWRKQRDLALENIRHFFIFMHLKIWYFLREWEQGEEMPKMCWLSLSKSR